MKKYLNSATKTSSIQKPKRDDDYSVARCSSIPRLRTSGSMGGISNIPISVIKQRPSAQPTFSSNYSSKLLQLVQRVSVTEKRSVKDVRPLSEKWYMQKCIQQVQEFLIEKNYSFPHGTRILSNPTTKSFYHIFEFMYCWLDPSYTTTEKPEEIIYILKLINYPFINNIKRSQLLVVGPQSWPNLLGVLTWMIPLIQYIENCDMKAFMNDNEFEGTEFCYTLQETIARNYNLFTSSGEANYEIYDQLAENLFGNFESLNLLMQDKEEFEKELRMLEEELENMHEIRILRDKTKSDITCVNNYIDEMNDHISQKEKDIEELEQIINKKQLEYDELKPEVSKLEKIYNDQEISTQSVEYVNVQKSYLIKKIDENKVLMENAKKALWEEEMTTASQIQKVQNKCSEFNKIYQQFRMEVKNYYKVELPEFEFNPSANSLQYNVWIENINPKLLDSETRIKDITVKNENLLLEQQNLKKGLAMQNAELHLSLQVFETKLEQQQKLQDARRQVFIK
ncbi:kinetochore protein NDC80 homolog [Centruroides sculpturatus]|uniref:kinetochore protein NDC80 homolog n=1 Tax=Centruroides sculpturatus TaxID=218467 RepID=UPI000C6ED2B4|nr:kinetochore protein NDC80 homolog [Centruroides sculpturatus]XP_023232562.1 kinetochore protein NDC80 homolog [Centruroides sculpturatus]XP_023232563.1 kinetochore protein NDC80 homolog [Centruroides sculpturatus]XP_023232564.1 kinetochore protein NDC80 homolog [Centruroides sculpturatus]XP_023232565.1 kinetochore protein NDC80 homolog [Centruroides sculpturatus]